MLKPLLIASLLPCPLIMAGCGAAGPAPVDMTATAEGEFVLQLAATGRSVMETATAEGAATVAPLTPTPTITATPDPFPTRVKASIYVAEQPFEGGRMFWLQPNSQIWLLTTDASGEHIWSVYDDSFVEGEAESDPRIVPPAGRYQPIRGFGKLWRQNPEVRQTLGWAVEREQGHTTTYKYYHGGHLDDAMQYVPGPGYHEVESVSGDDFIFDEAAFSWRVDD